MSKHTPGPWEINSPGIGNGIFAPRANKWIASEVVSGGFTTQEQRDEELLNARLIAAAPELLETVRWMAQTTHQAYHQDHAGTFETCQKNTCDAATKAIKAAKGEE